MSTISALKLDTPEKVLTAQFFDVVFCAHDLSRLEEFLHPDYIQHDFDVPPGIEGFRENFSKVFSIFPQFHVTLHHLIQDGDMIAAHGYGITDPGKIEVLLVDTYRLKDGKLYEHWGTIQPLPPEQFGNPALL